jgi:hypothetical protein
MAPHGTPSYRHHTHIDPKGPRMNLRRLAAAAFALAAAATLTLTTQTPAGANGAFVTIRNYGNGLCLQPAGGSTDQGAAIVQEQCNGGIAQGWLYISLGGTSYRFMNQLSGYCLDARGLNVNGTPVQQWTCGSISNEKWDTQLKLPDAVPLISQVAGTKTHCLDEPGASAQPGLALQLYRCNGTYAQGWVVGQA